MKEYTTGIKSAVIVIHQMFIVLMVCGLFGTGYVAQRDLQGMGLLMLLSVIGLVGSFVTLAYLTGISGRKSTDDPAIYLNMVDKVYTDVQNWCFLSGLYTSCFIWGGDCASWTSPFLGYLWQQEQWDISWMWCSSSCI